MAGTLIHRVDPYNRTAPMIDRQTTWLVRRFTQQIQGIAAGRNQKKMATYQSVGAPSTYLQNGPQTINFIVNGDLGQISRAWISFNITVSNAPVTLLPAFMWIDRIHSYRDSTNSKGMESNWVANLMSFANLLPSQFDSMAKAMLCDPEDAWSVEPLQPATYNVYVPLYYTTLFTGANLHYYPERMNISIDSLRFQGLSFSPPLMNQALSLLRLAGNISCNTLMDMGLYSFPVLLIIMLLRLLYRPH